MAKRYGRVHRLLEIITLIQARPGLSNRTLAKVCGVCPRTLYRDLVMLKEAGVPCYADSETGGYHIRKDFFLPPVDLTLEEALALLALAEQVGQTGQIPHLQPAAKAIAKIRSHLPAKVRKPLAELDHRIAIQLARSAGEEDSRDVYELIRRAVAMRRMVNCRYESVRAEAKSPSEAFLFHPYSLFFGQRAWYVLGYHTHHQAVRCLKLNRFTDVQPTDKPYVIPKDFSFKAYFGQAWRMIPDPQNRLYDVVIHFDPAFAETIADTHWHDTQEIEYRDDGSILFRCRVSGLREIVWWVLSMGPHCTVRQPLELAQQVRELARKTADAYDDASHSMEPHP